MNSLEELDIFEENEEEMESHSKIEEENEFTQEELENKLKQNPNSLETIILLLETYHNNKETNKLAHLRSEAQKSFLLPEGYYYFLFKKILIMNIFFSCLVGMVG